MEAVITFLYTVGDFIIATVAGEAAVGAVGALTSAAIGATAIVGGTVGLSKLFEIEMNVPDTDYSRQRTVKGGTQPVKTVYGEALVSGPIAFLGAGNSAVSSSGNESLYHVIALTGHESESITDIYFDNVKIQSSDINGGAATGGAVSGSTVYGPVNSTTITYINKHLGDETDEDSMVSAQFAKWTSDHVGQGVTYIATQFYFPDDSDIADVWNKHTPSDIKALVKGVKTIYDPRDDTGGNGAAPGNSSFQSWSDNPALCLADYMTNTEWGMGIPTSKVDWDAVADAADYCDELQSIPGSATQKRFTCNGVLFGTEAHQNNVSKLLSSMNGSMVYTGGKYVINAGQYIAPGVDDILTEDDLNGHVTLTTSTKRSDRFNTITGVFNDPDQLHKQVEFPKVQISSAVTRDNSEVLTKQIQLSMTNNVYMAQRLAYQMIKRSNDQMVLDFPANLKGLRVAIGDRVKVTINQFAGSEADPISFVNKVFVCTNFSFTDSNAGGVNLTLVEDTEANYYDATVTPALIMPVAAYSSVDLSDGSITDGFRGVPAPSSLSAVGVAQGIALTWTNPLDPLEFDNIKIYRVPGTASTFVSGDVDQIYYTKNNFYNIFDIAENTTFTFWIEAIKAGSASSKVGPDSATAGTLTADSIPWTDVTSRNIGVSINASDEIELTGVDTDSSDATGQAIAQSGIEQDIVITQGGMTVDGGGAIRSEGRDDVDFSSGDAGFFLGYDSTAYKFGVGNSSENMVWDGSNLNVTGGITATSGTFAGSVNVNSSGKMYGGSMTTFNSGAGFFLGYDTDAYKFSVGDSTSKVLTWDGDNLNVQANIVSFTTGGAPDYDSNSRFPTSMRSSVLDLGSNTAYVFFDNKFDQNLTLFVSYYAGPLTSGTISGETNAQNAVMAQLSMQIQYAPNNSGSPGTWTNFGSAAVSQKKYTSSQLNSNYYVKTTDLGGGNFRADLATKSQAAADFSGIGYSETEYGITDEEYYMTERVTEYAFPKGQYFLRVVVTVTDGTYSPYPASGSPSVSNNRRLSIPNALTYTDSDHGTSAVSVGNDMTYFTSPLDNQTLLDGGSLSLMPPEEDATSNKYAGIFIGGRGETSDASSIQPLGGIWFYEGMDDMGTGAGSLGSPDFSIYMPPAGGNLLFSGNVNFNNNVDVDGTLSINGVTVNAGAVTGPAGSDGQIQYNNGGALGGSSNLTFNDTTNTLSVTNLTVSGTTTSIDTTNLNVSDKNITLNYGTGDTSSNADGAGITIQDAVDASTDATLNWTTANDRWEFSHQVKTPSLMVGSKERIDSDGDLNNIRNANISGTLTLADELLISRTAADTRKIVLWDNDAGNDYQFYGFGVESESFINSIYATSDTFYWYAGVDSTSRQLAMSLSGTGNATFAGKIEVGTFSNSQTNSGEAWIGRASDRDDGTLTIQLGGNVASGTKFEIVDRAWTKVIASISGEAPESSFVINSSGEGSFAKQVEFPSANDERPVLTGGFLGRQTGDGDVDIWGISETYYPSAGTTTNAWGIRWASSPNQIQFVGGNVNRVTFDLDQGNTVIGGSITSGAITSSGKVTVSGSSNSYSTAPVVYFDSTSTANAGVRDWAIGPADDAYGNFHIFVGASTGADPVNAAGRLVTITNAGDTTIRGKVTADGSSGEIGLFKSSEANVRIKIQSTYTSTATNSAYIDLHTGNSGRGYLIKNGNGAGNALPANSLYLWNSEGSETSLISNATIGRRFAVTSGGTATKYQDTDIGTTFVSTSTNSGAGQGFKVVKSYTNGAYVSLIEAPYSSGTNADIRLAAKFTSSGSSFHFGTSNSYGYITKEPLVLDHAGNAYIKQIVGGQDGDTFTVPIDQDTGYSNHSFGSLGVLHRNSYDAYITSNAYYYRTSDASSWYSKYSNRHVAALDFVDGEIVWRVTSTKATAANQAASISEKFRITSTGGITAKGLITADDADIFIDDSLAGGNSSAYTDANRLRFSNSHTDVARGPNKITMYDNDAGWQGGFGIHSGTVSYYSGSAHRWYNTTSSGYTERMELLGTGALEINGPTFKLIGSNNLSMSTGGQGQIQAVGNGYTGAIALDGSAMHIYHNSSARDLVLGTNETARLTIDGNGGTTTLSTNLEMGNTLYLGNTSAGSFVGVSGANLEARADGAFYVFTYSGSWGERLSIGDNLATFKSPITSQATDTGDGARVARWIYPNNESSYRLDLHQRVTSNVVRYSFGQVNNGTTYDDVLVLDRGKIGVKTQNPTYQLDVVGSGRFKATGTGYSTSALFIQESTTSSPSTTHITNVGGNTYISSNSGADQFFITSDGRVTINNSNVPLSHAMLNIGWNSGETRAIDIDGSWSSGESKSISFTHGTSTSNLVGQMRMTYNIANGVNNNSSGSVFQIGRFYHNGDSSAFPVSIYSQSTVEATVHIQALPTGTTAANRTFQVNTTGYGAIHAIGNQSGTNGSADTIGMVTIGGNTGVTVQGGIYASQNSSTGTSIAIFTTDSYASGPKQTLSVLDNGVVNVDRGDFQVGGTTVINSSKNLTNIALAEAQNLAIDNTSSTTKYGLSLYGGNGYATDPIYGIMFTGTAQSGTHGNVTGNWATYFTMNSSSGRGWIFRENSTPTNVASISNTGNASFNGNVTAYASDARLKTGVKRIERPLEKLQQIRGVEFDWIDGIEELGFVPSSKRETGVIAQDIQAVIPDAVAPAPFDNNYLTVHKDKIVPLLIEAIKEQQDQIDELKALIKEMKNGDN